MFSKFLGGCISLADYTRGRIYAGLLFLAPFVLTLAVLAWIFGTLSSAIEPLFVGDSARYLAVSTITLLLLAPFTVGLLLLFMPTRRIFTLMEKGAQRLPFAGSIFRVGKNVSAAFDPDTQHGFNRVVQIEYPRDGVWSLGFLTGVVENEDDGTQWAVVFLPTAPLPNSGWIAYVAIDNVVELEMSTSEAMQITLSGGSVTPRSFKRKKLPTSELPRRAGLESR